MENWLAKSTLQSTPPGRIRTLDLWICIAYPNMISWFMLRFEFKLQDQICMESWKKARSNLILDPADRADSLSKAVGDRPPIQRHADSGVVWIWSKLEIPTKWKIKIPDLELTCGKSLNKDLGYFIWGNLLPGKTLWKILAVWKSMQGNYPFQALRTKSLQWNYGNLMASLKLLFNYFIPPFLYPNPDDASKSKVRRIRRTKVQL